MLGLLASTDLEQRIINLSTNAVLFGSIILIVAVVAAALAKNKIPKLKLPFFIVIAGTMAAVTLTLVGSTIYLNVNSESGGPVHWHADYEIWACDTEVELRGPTGALSNKVGTSSYHEHDDKRIHLEGVVVDKEVDASLGKFMAGVGGYINDTRIEIPLDDEPHDWFTEASHDDGDEQNLSAAALLTSLVSTTPAGKVLNLKNGAGCGSELAKVQAFVYSFNKSNDTYSQTKLADPAKYIVSDEPVVPPGDCVIIEYAVPKDRTNKLCKQYGSRDSVRCTEFGVKKWSASLCNIREVDADSQENISNEETYYDETGTAETIDYSLCDDHHATSLPGYCSETTTEDGDHH